LSGFLRDQVRQNDLTEIKQFLLVSFRINGDKLHGGAKRRMKVCSHVDSVHEKARRHSTVMSDQDNSAQ